MKLSFVSVSLAALATASTFVRRDVPTVLSNIDTLMSSITNVTESIATYNGNGPRALEIQAQVTDLEDVVKKVTDSINDSAPFDNADSTTVAGAILKITPIISSSLNNITAQKDKFEAALPGIAAALIAQDLVDLQARTDDLGKALEAKLTGAFAKATPVIISNVDKQFQDAINSYGGPHPPVGGSSVSRPLSFFWSFIVLGLVGLMVW